MSKDDSKTQTPTSMNVAYELLLMHIEKVEAGDAASRERVQEAKRRAGV